MSNDTKYMIFSGDDYDLSPGNAEESVRLALSTLVQENILARIRQRDYRVWKPLPTEISNRLGWLDSPTTMLPQISRIQAEVDSIKAEGFTHALLLGMGGSSLAPEVFAKTFGIRPGYLELSVLDSTHPDAVLAAWRRCPPDRTLLIVSTKSGGTIETLSLFKASFNWVAASVGMERAPRHCIAITDPGSGLQTLVETLGVRSVFLNDPDIGGRYSVLSSFGLVPAALVGVDIATILSRGMGMFERVFSAPCRLVQGNSAILLGCLLGVQAEHARDKLTLILPECIVSFGAWVEQLIAESIGKEGKGIVPVPVTSLDGPTMYRKDQTFVAIMMDGEKTLMDQSREKARIDALIDAGFPVMKLKLHDIVDLGAEFVRWEMATIVAGWKLGINPFDQPNVESAKVLARKMMTMYQQNGRLPGLESTSEERGITLYDLESVTSPSEGFRRFLSLIDKDESPPLPYVSIHAYLPATAALNEALERFAEAIRRRSRIAVTIGYGPRFLHSTGQLHKGDAGHGRFIQFVGPIREDIPIPENAGYPDSTISFGILVHAQSLGDRQALIDGGRRVIRFDCGQNAVATINYLTTLVEG